MLEEMIAAVDELFKKNAELMQWDFVTFHSFICMAIEEWCRANGGDAVESARMVAEMVAKVTEEKGRYGA